MASKSTQMESQTYQTCFHTQINTNTVQIHSIPLQETLNKHYQIESGDKLTPNTVIHSKFISFHYKRLNKHSWIESEVRTHKLKTKYQGFENSLWPRFWPQHQGFWSLCSHIASTMETASATLVFNFLTTSSIAMKPNTVQIHSIPLQ